MTKHRYSKEQVIQAIHHSKSIREVLIFLGVSSKGGQYKTFHKFVTDNDIDITPLKGKKWAKDLRLKPRISTDEYLNNSREIGSFRLKKRLLDEKILSPICSMCEGVTWIGHPIPLELDHIDGNHHNNNIENIRLLCPNCHALTDTYRGKNQKRCGARGGTRTPKGYRF